MDDDNNNLINKVLLLDDNKFLEHTKLKIIEYLYKNHNISLKICI